jgi:hypothetical protein
MSLILPAFLAVYLGFASRLHGGGFWSNVPKPYRNAIWTAPFGVISFWVSIPLGMAWAVALGVISFALCFAGKATGHGNFMDLGRTTHDSKDERIEFLIKPLKDRLPIYWYDALGLSVVGLIAVSGGVIALGIQNPLSGLILAIGGMSKAIAYMIGWIILPDGAHEDDFWHETDEATEIGEVLSGVFAGIALGLAILIA